MAENSQDLPLKLAQARQALKDAQARVAKLEADLATDFTSVESPNPLVQQHFQTLVEYSRDPKDSLSSGFAESTDLIQPNHAAEQSRKLNRRLGMLSDINQAIVRVRHLPTLFEKACAIAVESGNFCLAWIGLLEPATRHVNVVAHVGMADDELEKLDSIFSTDRIEQHPLASHLHMGERWVCNDLENDPQMAPWRADALRLGYRAVVALPLLIKGTVRGTFNLYADQAHFFDEAELKLVEEMAMDLSFAMAFAEQAEQHQQAEATAKRYAQRMEILHSIDTGIINATSTETVVEAALSHIRQLIPCQRATVILFDFTTEEGVIFADDANHPSSLRRAARSRIPPGWDQEFDTDQTRMIDDLRLLPSTPVYSQLIQEGLVSGIQAPLVAQGQLLGLLGLNADAPGFFTAEHQDIATEVANQIAVAIQQMYLSEEIIRHTTEVERHIDAIRRTDEALRHSETLFRGTFEQAAVGIAHIAPDGGWLRVNQRLCNIIGYTEDELISKDFQEITHPADLVSDRTFSRQLVHGEIPFYAIQKRYFHQRGHIVWINLTVSLVRDGQGVPDYFVAVAEDITQLKAAEHALLASEERYRSVVEAQVDLIGRFQSDYKLTFVNRAYSQAFDKRPDELIGQSILDLIPEDAHAGVIAHFSSMGLSRPIATFENPLQLADGTLRWFQWTNQITLNEAGRPLEYLAVGRDITDQKKLQVEQARQSEAVEEMRQFLESALDAFPASTAVLASDGTILKTNAAWRHFCQQNNGLSPQNYLDVNYLTVCDNATGAQSADAKSTAAGIRAVIQGERDDFYLEYPCHSPAEKRWFGLRVTPFAEAPPRRVVAAHINITERVQIEEVEREQRHFAEALRDSLAALTTSLDVNDILQQILDYAVMVAPCNAGSIILLEDGYGRVAYLHGFAPETINILTNYQLPLEALVYGDMLVNKAPYLVPDTQVALDWIPMPHTAWIRSSIGVPIESRGKIIGVLSVDSAIPHHFQPTDIEKLQVFASYASLALETAYHVTELEQRVIERTAELQAAKERVEGILHNSLDGILLVDPELRIQQTNVAFNTLVGCTPDDYFFGSLRDLIHMDDLQHVNEVVQMVLRERDGKQAEMCCYRKNGLLFDAELSIGYIKADSLVLTLRDITERKRAQNALAEERNLLRTLIDAMPELIYVKDRQHQFVLCNAASGYVLHNLKPTELIGKTDFDFFPLAVAEEFYENEEAVFRTGQALLNDERSLINQDGSNVWISTTKVPLRNLNGELIGLAGFSRDITERKVREHQLLFNASLQETVMDAVIATSLDFRIQSWNRAAETIYGWRAEEVMGRLINEVLQTDFEPGNPVDQAQHDLLEKGYWTGEAIQRHKAGRALHVLGSTVLFKDAQGIPFGVVSVNHDITDRKKAEQAMRAKMEEEHTFQNYLKDLHEITIELTQIDQLDEFYKQTIVLGRSRLGFDRMALFLYDAQQNAALGTFGTDPTGELCDEHFICFTPKPDDILWRAFQASERFCVQEARPLYHSLKPIGNGWNAAAALGGRTQRIGWLVADNLLHQQPVTKPLLEIFALYALTIGTLLGRKKIEAALRESEARYRLLADNITDMVMCFNAAGEFVYASPSSLALLGYAPAALLGQSGFDFIHPDDRAAVQFYNEVLEQSIPTAFLTCRFLHQAGHYLWMEFALHIIRSEVTGELVEIVISARDVTTRKQAEDDLRESEQRFRRLVEAAPVAIVISDQAGQITLINQQASLLFDYTEVELVGQPIAVLAPEAIRHWQTSQQAAIMAATQVRRLGFGLEVLASRKDGSEFPVEIELSYIETKTGLLVMSFIVDITERKQSAAALEEQRTFLREVIDVNPSMIFVKDYAGRFVLVNPVIAKMYNTSVDALVGKCDADFNPDLQEVETFLAADRRVIDSGEPLFMEEPLTNIYGETHWLQTTKVPIISADGKSKHVLGISTDITARKKAEEALRQNEELLRTVLENLPVGVWIIDPKGVIRQGNPVGQQIWGGAQAIGIEAYNEYKRWWDDLETRLVADKWPGVQVIAAAITQAMTQGETSLNQELEIETFDGAHKYILNSAIPIRDHSQQIQGVLVVNQEITELKQNEKMIRQALAKEQELGELKSRFVSMASHEFRTPLASILALTETLRAYRHRLTDAQIEQRLGKIQEQVDHLQDIMEDVLQLARLQARRTEFNPMCFNLDGLCHSILEEFQSQSDLVQQLLYTCNDTLREVALDKKLMRHIISNLISNAIKYSYADTTITVNLAYASEMLILSVHDQGIGIPAADLNHLFEPFHRAINVGTISGTGLGLVIAKESVELHGGSITVESQIGVGTTFTVSIPIGTSGATYDKNPGD